MNFNRQTAYLGTVLVAAGFELLCPIVERTRAPQIVAECLFFLCVGTSLLGLGVAGLWTKGISIPSLVSAGFLTATIPFVNALILWMLQVDVSFHGVAMGALLVYAALSFSAAVLLFVSASVKHIKAVN